MTKIKMALALDKLIKDVKAEKILWSGKFPSSQNNSEEEDDAWNRVALKNKISGGEAKSIFKVLYKKYRQESLKPVSSWQLFDSLRFLDAKFDVKSSLTSDNSEQEQSVKSPASNHDEETFVELLEVKEEDFSDDDLSPSAMEGSVVKKEPEDTDDIKPTLSLNNGTIPNKSLLITSKHEKSIEKPQQQQNRQQNSFSQNGNNTTTEKSHNFPSNSNSIGRSKEREKEKSISPSVTISSIKRKYLSPENNHNSKDSSESQHESFVEKRRMLKQQPQHHHQQLQQQQPKQQHQHQQQQLDQQKEQIQDHIENSNGLNVLTVPAKDIAEAVANISPIDSTLSIENDGNAGSGQDKKYDSFGSYIASIMNRLTPRLAARLEIKILQSIIDINSEMMNNY